MLEIGLAAQEGFEGLARRGGHCIEDALELSLDDGKLREGRGGGTVDGEVGVELRMLVQVADAPAALDLNRAVIGLELARDDAKERALALAVASHQSDAFSGLDGKGGAIEHHMRSVGEPQIRGREERHSPILRGVAKKRSHDDDAAMPEPFVRMMRHAASAGLLAGLVAIGMVGCNDSFRVEAPYDWVWERSTEALVAAGFEMVVVPDEKTLIPASSRRTGRAWFTGYADDIAGWKPPRIIEVTIDPVQPAETAWRTIEVKVEDRSWTAKGRVPDPDMRGRVTWILRQALEAPGNAPPPEDGR